MLADKPAGNIRGKHKLTKLRDITGRVLAHKAVLTETLHLLVAKLLADIKM